MENDKLATLIPSLEKFAAEKPDSYKLRVALLAVLGYAYLLVVVLILLGLSPSYCSTRASIGWF